MSAKGERRMDGSREVKEVEGEGEGRDTWSGLSWGMSCSATR